MNTVSIAALRQAGITISAEEAVAIAQQLIHTRSAAPPIPPFGPPTPDSVCLSIDGTVRSLHREMPPPVAEVAILLDALVPAGTPGVAGGLRYTIARALHDVDAPPFDSVESFSDALARFEKGNPADAIRQLVERFEMIQVTAARPFLVERRRFSPTTDHLQRQLREADARLFTQRAARREIRILPPVPPRKRVAPAIAACVACGLALIGAGEWMHTSRLDGGTREDVPIVVHRATPLPAPEALPALAPAAEIGALPRGDIVKRPVRMVRR